MQGRYRVERKGFALTVLFTISFFSLFLGLSLCLIKSPAEKAASYLALSNSYLQKIETEILSVESSKYILQESKEALYEAVRLTPYDVNVWKAFSLYFSHAGKISQALQAQDMVSLLGEPDFSPLIVKKTMRSDKVFLLSENKSSVFQMKSQ